MVKKMKENIIYEDMNMEITLEVLDERNGTVVCSGLRQAGGSRPWQDKMQTGSAIRRLARKLYFDDVIYTMDRRQMLRTRLCERTVSSSHLRLPVSRDTPDWRCPLTYTVSVLEDKQLQYFTSSSPILYENVRKTALNFQKFLLDLNTDYFGHYHIYKYKTKIEIACK